MLKILDQLEVKAFFWTPKSQHFYRSAVILIDLSK